MQGIHSESDEDEELDASFASAGRLGNTPGAAVGSYGGGRSSMGGATATNYTSATGASGPITALSHQSIVSEYDTSTEISQLQGLVAK